MSVMAASSNGSHRVDRDSAGRPRRKQVADYLSRTMDGGSPTAPLASIRVLVTRPEDGEGGLCDQLRAEGAEVLSLPLTRLERMDPAPLRGALERMASFDWMIVTSLNGVAIVCDELEGLPGGVAAMESVRVAVVGAATAAALRARGIEPAVVPLSYNADALLGAVLEADDVSGKRILLAVAEGARDVVPAGLAEAGADVEIVHVYRTRRDDEAAERVRALMQGPGADLVVFTAGSGVHAFGAAVGESACAGLPVATIGPATTMVAETYAMDVRIEASESTIPGLVHAIVSHYIPADE
jgi:uroporphyrinogen III methyltransferase / synthase